MHDQKQYDLLSLPFDQSRATAGKLLRRRGDPPCPRFDENQHITTDQNKSRGFERERDRFAIEIAKPRGFDRERERERERERVKFQTRLTRNRTSTHSLVDTRPPTDVSSRANEALISSAFFVFLYFLIIKNKETTQINRDADALILLILLLFICQNLIDVFQRRYPTTF